MDRVISEPADGSPHRLRGCGLRALIAGTGLTAAGVLSTFLTASLAPRIRNDVDFGDSELGLAIAICYAVSALSSTPLGRLAGRIGAARGMLLAVTLTATS